MPEKWTLESKVYTEDSCSDPDPAVSGEAWDYSTNSNRIFSAEKQIAFGKDAEVTFTNRLNTTSVTVRKVWNDENNKDGIRPASIQVQLKADGNAKGDPVTLNGSETPVPWTYTWSDVPEKDGERTIVYTVDETAVPAYYEKEIDGDAAEGFIITNTHVPETVNISGTKIWNDSDNEDGIRPGSVTVSLFAGETVNDSRTVSGPEWSFSWTGWPKYTFTVSENGSVSRSEISYTVAEADVPEYSADIVQAEDGSFVFTITNTHIPELVDVSVVKTWDDNDDQDGLRPDTLTVELLADNAAFDPPKTVTLTKEDEWAQKTIGALPKYVFTVGEDGSVTKTEIVYSWREVDLPEDYSLTDSSANGSLTTLTNRHDPARVSVRVTKVWNDENNKDGIRPASIQVQLMADGTPCGDPVTLDGSETPEAWSYTWTDLDEKAGGQTIVYTVDEVAVPDFYEKEISGDAAEGFIITNSHTPKPPVVPPPRTGDESHLVRYTMLMSLSFAGIVFVLTKKRKEERA